MLTKLAKHARRNTDHLKYLLYPSNTTLRYAELIYCLLKPSEPAITTWNCSRYWPSFVAVAALTELPQSEHLIYHKTVSTCSSSTLQSIFRCHLH